MDTKKQIIVNELKYWKEHRLLPDVYCNFLLSLYTEGTENPSDTPKRSRKNYFRQSLSLFIVLTLVALSFVVIYFTEFSSLMQISVLTSIMLLSLGIGIFYYRQRNVVFHVYIILAAFMSFFHILKTAELFFENDTTVLGVLIAMLCAIWFTSGWKWKLHYLHIAGFTGILLYFIFLSGISGN